MSWFKFQSGVVVSTLIACAGIPAAAQAKPAESISPQHALELARNGHCREALPLLKKSIAPGTAKDTHKDVGLAGVRCAMFSDQPDTALDFLRMLNRDFPNDPDVLYLSVHTYSDLSTRASAQLATKDGNSYQAHELNAEALETQGKWQDAEKEYRGVLEKNPKAPGIHFRLGRLLLSVPNPPAENADKAKKEFEAELAIDPANAGAEYVLGELDRQSNDFDGAVQHFSKATKLDGSFAAAYLGLGVALMSQKSYSEAIAPLETAVKMQPDNPAAHYSLATAYARAGRKADADREFAIHNHMLQRSGGAPVQTNQQP
jgi:tetratricopeptide (TPR) repeat protein